MAAVSTIASPAHVWAQPTSSADVAVGLAWAAPIEQRAPSFLLRVGVLQRRPANARTARLALEALIQPSDNSAAALPARALVGFAYDALVPVSAGTDGVRFVGGATVSRPVGQPADTWNAWLVAPRVGVRYERTTFGRRVGAELLLQSLMFGTGGVLHGRIRRPFVPMSVTVRF